MKYPDAKKHQQVSFVKSLVRCVGYVLLLTNMPLAVIILLASELIGVLEELV